jgi:hypothetical protein
MISILQLGAVTPEILFQGRQRLEPKDTLNALHAAIKLA